MSLDGRILVTGGAGSIGSNLVLSLLTMGAKTIAFDSNEYGLACLEQEAIGLPLEVAVGDVRDKDRLREVLKDVDVVVHTAALKRVEMAEFNIVESIKVNVLGTINVLGVCREESVSRFLLISSDKAVPTGEMGNYGVTKLIQERLTFACHAPPVCAVARFGNVRGTRGDVFEIWERQKSAGKVFTITNAKMRRFYWSMAEAIDFIIKCLGMMKGGEVFVPEMKEYNLADMFRATYGENAIFVEMGQRPGEVFLHELMTESERLRAKREPWGWVIK